MSQGEYCWASNRGGISAASSLRKATDRLSSRSADRPDSRTVKARCWTGDGAARPPLRRWGIPASFRARRSEGHGAERLVEICGWLSSHQRRGLALATIYRPTGALSRPPREHEGKVLGSWLFLFRVRRSVRGNWWNRNPGGLIPQSNHHLREGQNIFVNLVLRTAGIQAVHTKPFDLNLACVLTRCRERLRRAERSAPFQMGSKQCADR